MKDNNKTKEFEITPQNTKGAYSATIKILEETMLEIIEEAFEGIKIKDDYTIENFLSDCLMTGLEKFYSYSEAKRMKSQFEKFVVEMTGECDCPKCVKQREQQVRKGKEKENE